MQQAKRSSLAVYLALLSIVFIWSAINPYERHTWWLEVAPVLIALPILLLTYQRFTFTPLVYFFIFICCVLLLIGGHYTYAKVPVFDWLRDEFDLARNHFDRVGHFMQGLLPALITREILIRQTGLKSGIWLILVVILSCTGIAAIYELIEWVAAEIMGEDANSFLGMQGDDWDTQKDMALALLGAITALICFSKMHDRQMGN